jgi:hypothetical protein
VSHSLTLLSTLFPLVLLGCTSDRPPPRDAAAVPMPDAYVPWLDGLLPAAEGGRPDVVASGCTFVEPTGSTAKNPVTFKVAVTGPVARVRYVADPQYPLGESTDAAAGFAITYSFSQLGARVVTAHGLGSDDTELASCSLTIEIKPAYPDVPYFYQYDNTLYPSSTCQNTSIAMVLAYLGWTGKPDDITATWGKDHAQTPAGLAEVFNDYATKMGSSHVLTSHTDGTVQDVRDLLAQGEPVIVHGYFTSCGHVMVTLGFSGTHYLAHDPAGKWSEVFKGGYGAGQTPTSGKAVSYAAAAFEAAIATSDGTTFEPIFYHELK